MKTLFAFLTVCIFSVNAMAATLTLRFKVKSIEGQVMWAVYAPHQKFPGEHASSFSGKTLVTSHDVITKVENVPFGTYAVAATHDINSNGKMDYRFGMIPKEPFGFSNGAKATIRGAPTFDQAKFNFTDESQVFDVILEKF